MIKCGNVMEENIKEHNPNWPKIPNFSYRILIIGGSRSGKSNSLFNPIIQEADIDKIHIC